MAPEEGNPAGRHDAVRPAAIGDDLCPRRQEGEVLPEVLERDRDRARDMTSLVLLAWTQVEEDDVPGLGAADELVAADRLELAGCPEVRADDLLDLGQAVVGDRAQRRQQLQHVVAREAVEDPWPLAPRLDEPCLAECLEMRGSQGYARVGLAGQGLDAVLALGEEVEQLDPAGAGQGLADSGELLVEGGLRRAWARHLPHSNDRWNKMVLATACRTAERHIWEGPLVTITPFVDEGLGNSSYLVDLGEGRALVVDPTRDVTAYARVAEATRLRLAYSLETHLHADFVSGSRELARRGATVLAPRAGQVEFPHRGLDDEEELDLGGVTLRALGTPGHTPEHLGYLLLDGPNPVAMFSGGALIVGGVARTDLINPDETEPLARQLYRALRDRILILPDELPVYPTHGAGSFCSAPGGGERTTTIGRERTTNPLLAAPDEEAFVRRLLAGLGTYPDYFLRLREINRRGPVAYGDHPPLLPGLTPDELDAAVRDGAELIDVRPIDAFAAGHIPGALSIALRDSFASWLGWLVDAERPLVFVLDDTQSRAEVVRHALKVGYEHLTGELAGGMAAWRAAGRREARTELLRDPTALRGPILDVRQAAEYAAGHVPTAALVELGSLREKAGDLANEPVTVMCGHGERAATAASLLERAGGRPSVFVGGTHDWSRAVGRPPAIGA